MNNDPYSEPVKILRPSRICSFDETHTEISGTEVGSRKKIVVVRAAEWITREDGTKVLKKKSADREMIVNKSAAVLTQVGGSCADGRALPQMNIIPAKSIDPLVTLNSAKCGFEKFVKYDNISSFYDDYPLSERGSTSDISFEPEKYTRVSAHYESQKQEAIWSCNDSGG